MKKITYLLLICYGIIAIADIFFTLYNQPSFRHITKPLLMPLLMLAVFAEAGFRNKFSSVFILALFFSWLGDIVLMFDGFFIAGLVCFLIAQLGYLFYFFRIKGPKGMI